MSTGKDFGGKVVIITGAAGGIGAATARRFATDGAALVLVDRDREPLAEVAQALDGHAFPTDLRDEDAIDTMVEAVVAEHGRIDVLLNIAGIFVGTEGLIEATSRKLWDLSLDVNLRSTHHLVSRVVPHMSAAGVGTIVNTSSTQARAADVGWASYGIAKAGVESLTRYVATQYGPRGIRCNCVAPGVTATPRAMERFPEERAHAIEVNTPLRRFGRPDELADVYYFLASERSSFVTGQVLAVDGGLTVHLPTT